MKNFVIFLLCLFLALNFFAQMNERQSKSLYTLPNIFDRPSISELQVTTRNSNTKNVYKASLPTVNEIRSRAFVNETSNTVIASESGLYMVTPYNQEVPLWEEGAVKQILPVKENSWDFPEAFYFITDKGILYTENFSEFELRNSGLPTYVLKKYDGKNTEYETHVQDLKDLAYNPLNPLEMVTATKEKVYVTRNGGASWKSLGSAGRTNGIKAVGIASMKFGSGEKTRKETVVFLSHAIFGFFYYRLDAASPSWQQATGGLYTNDSTNSCDEISDILPIIAQDENGFSYCELFLAQTFAPRIYQFDMALAKSKCIYKGEEPCDTIDALWQVGSNLAFMSPCKVGMYDINTGVVSELNDELYSHFSTFNRSDALVNAAWIPKDSLRYTRINGDVLLNELWLLDSGKILSPYAQKIDGQKSLYVPCYQAYVPGGTEKFKKIILDNKLNSLVIDMKDDYGYLRYDSKDPLVLKKGSVSRYAIDLTQFVKTFKEDNIYLIARIVVFKDKNLSTYNNGAYAVWDKQYKRAWQGISSVETAEDGTEQVKYYDEFWVDPFCPEVWEYNVAIAKELVERGFDEVQFDYIRFPTDGKNLGNASFRWQSHSMDKEGALRSFLSYARENINAPIGIDIYGANGWYRSGARTGQDVETLAQYVDVICPMFYPSHFENKFMNYKPYEERPYRIYYYGTYRNTIIARDRVVVRPWVQAFFLNVPYDRQYYDTAYVLKEVFGVRDSVDRGYMHWNNSGNYSKLSPDPGDAEYTGPSPEAARNFRKPAIGTKYDPLSFYATQPSSASIADKTDLSVLDSVLEQDSNYRSLFVGDDAS